MGNLRLFHQFFEVKIECDNVISREETADNFGSLYLPGFCAVLNALFNHLFLFIFRSLFCMSFLINCFQFSKQDCDYSVDVHSILQTRL